MLNSPPALPAAPEPLRWTTSSRRSDGAFRAVRGVSRRLNGHSLCNAWSARAQSSRAKAAVEENRVSREIIWVDARTHISLHQQGEGCHGIARR